MQQRDPLDGDQVHRVGGVELLLEHHSSTSRMPAADDRERADVEHGHDAPAIVTTATYFAVHRERDPAQFALPHDAALRGAGGTAGEQQTGDVVGLRGELEFATGATVQELLVARPATGLTDDHQHRRRRQCRSEVGDHRRELFGDEHDRRCHAAQYVSHLRCDSRKLLLAMMITLMWVAATRSPNSMLLRLSTAMRSCRRTPTADIRRHQLHCAIPQLTVCDGAGTVPVGDDVTEPHGVVVHYVADREAVGGAHRLYVPLSSIDPATGPPPTATATTSGVVGAWRSPPSPHICTHASCRNPIPWSRPPES